MSASVQEERFLKAFEDYSDDLFRHAYFRVSSREKAVDLMQDTFAKVWDFIAGGGVVDQFRPFLYRTLNNLIIDEYRRKKTSSLDALLEDGHVSEGSFKELQTGGLKELENTLDAKRFLSELQHMPERYRKVVVMRYLDELSPQEISKITGDNENVISVRIHRGLQWLRKNAHY